MNLDRRNFVVHRWEYVLPALAIISLSISCFIISEKKFFWNDELYSYYLLNDPSFTQMMGAFHDKINNTPPLYFLLGWLWVRIFGSTELSLRLFSSTGICIAFIVVWITLRRTYSFSSTSFGTLAVFCTSNIILSQNSEARMYGLFLAVCSLGLLQYDLLNRSSNKAQWHSLFINGCIHGAIVQTHLFGIFYSGAILFAQILTDRYFNIFRYRVYLSIILSWLSLILYIPSFLNQSDAGYPRTWISNPSLKDLISLLSPSFPLFLGLNVLLLIIWYDKKCPLERKPKEIHCPQWLEKRILSNSRYKVTELGEIDEDRKLLLVEKP